MRFLEATASYHLFSDLLNQSVLSYHTGCDISGLTPVCFCMCEGLQEYVWLPTSLTC